MARGILRDLHEDGYVTIHLYKLGTTKELDCWTLFGSTNELAHL